MANLKAGATIQGHIILHAGNFDPTAYSAMKGDKGQKGQKGLKGGEGDKGQKGALWA